MLFIRSKIQFFESKSQPYIIQIMCTSGCLSDQRYNFLKANHNSGLRAILSACVVYQIKDTIFWKQITTGQILKSIRNKLFIRSKIQFFESKSQLGYSDYFISDGCLSDQRYNFLKANHNKICLVCDIWIVVYQIKDTIFWKQITTVLPCTPPWWKLFIRSKIQFFESKSQQ